MKLNKWLYGVTALAMLAACSDKDVAPGGEEDLDGSSSVANRYLAVEIKLPQETVTRAGDDVDGKNDLFDDGIAKEYEVQNAMLVVFKGSTGEKDATFYKAYNLVKPFFSSLPADDQITSTYIAAIPVDKLDGGDHYYGLAIINRDGTNTSLPNGSSTQGFTDDVKIGGNKLASTTKFSDVLEYITTISDAADTEFLNTYGFFMTNAPLANAPGTSFTTTNKITYLADLGSRTYDTMDEAKKAVKNCIYVERAVAKVTSGVAEGAYGYMSFVDKDGTPIKGISVTATVTYALTNTNMKSYVVRNVETTKLGDHFSWTLASTKNSSGARMIGTAPMPGLSSPFHEGENIEIDEETTVKCQKLYRTYWCHDPNYNRNMYKDGEPPAEGETTTAENTTSNEMFRATESDLKSISSLLYCRENTFDVKHQNNGNSTMVVYKIEFTVNKPGLDKDGGLYIKDGDHKKIYVKKEDACWSEITRIIKDPDIQDALKEAIALSPDITDYIDENKMVKDAQQYLDITIKADADKNLIIKSIAIKDDCAISYEGKTRFKTMIGTPNGKNSETGEVEGSQIQATLLTNVNGLSNITEFTDGVSYYYIPVKHFGDYYCPWTETVGTTTKDVYNDRKDFGTNDNHAKDYLGRYGMVRNNWYDLKINKIEALGSPTFPSIDVNLSDDNKEEKKYIGVEIHILSWAKRTQGVSF